MNTDRMRPSGTRFPLPRARLTLLSTGLVREERPGEGLLPEGCYTRASMVGIVGHADLEARELAPHARTGRRRELRQAADILVRPQLVRQVRPVPLRPRPCGLGTVEVESLSGYFLRLAEVNRITPGTLATVVWSGFLDHPALRGAFAVQRAACQGVRDLRPLEDAARLPQGTLDRLTARQLFRQFFAWGPDRDQLLGFCAGPRLLTGIMEKSALRFCPLCLRESPVYYRLVWKLADVTVCLRHGVYLMTRCPSCQKPSRSFHRRSVLGRCDHCRTVLGEVRGRPAPMSDISIQEQIHADYTVLLRADGSSPLAICDASGMETWRHRLRALRYQKHWSLTDLAKKTRTTCKAIHAAEATRAIPRFRDLLAWIRILSGSIEAFVQSSSETAAHVSP